MFTVANLIEKLPKSGSLEIKKLEKMLKLTKKNEKQELEIALKALKKLEIIKEDESGNICKHEENGFISSRLRCSSKGYCFAVREDGAEDIYIRDQHLNHAWNGDRVLIKITREGVRRRAPEGIVQCILERDSKTLLAHIDKEDEKLIAYPLDERILTNIELTESDLDKVQPEEKDYIYEVKIDNYPVAQYQTSGHILRALPINGGAKSDLELLVTKANIGNISDSPRIGLKTPTEKSRVDLTEQESLIFRQWNSKNSPLLPVLHAEPQDGGVRLSIHAPTLAERVNIGSNLDLWLRDRAECHCFGDSWRPLINESMIKAIKFKVGEINDAITLTIDINKQGELTNWKFYFSKIKPVAEITSKELQAIKEKKPRSRTTPISLKPIKEHINQIQTIIHTSNLLVHQESAIGLIDLDLPIPKLETLYDLNAEDPSSIHYQYVLPLDETQPNSLLRPIIRLANKICHEHFNALNLPSLNLSSYKLDDHIMNDLAKSALSLDLQIQLDEEGKLSTKQLSDAFKQSKHKRVLEKQLSHSLPFKILTINKSSGLNEESNETESDKLLDTELEISPWVLPHMHYHDLINQYVLVHLLREGKGNSNSRSKKKLDLGDRNSLESINLPVLSEAANHSLDDLIDDNLLQYLIKCRRQSKALYQSIVNMAQARQAEPYIGQQIQAVITGVQSYGFFAEIPPFMAEGLVHVSSLNDDWYEYRSRLNRLVGRKNRKVFQLGDSVNVKILNVDVLKNQIDLEIVRQEQLSEPTESSFSVAATSKTDEE